MKRIIIIIILILLCLSVVTYMYRNTIYDIIMMKKCQPILAPEPVLGYADINDAYIRPAVLSNVLTRDQCNEIINYCTDKLVDSEVVGGKYAAIRNSKQTWISKNDPLVKPLFEKIAKQYNLRFDQAEDLQVVRYLPDQYYNEHHDSCCDQNEACKTFAFRGGQRVLTVLIYLNNEFEGGHTYFKNLDLKVKPKTGDAVVFYPLAKGTNRCHPYGLHAGLPVTNGQKWIANLWFRENTFV